MPNQREQELLALLQAERLRNGSSAPTPELAPLPELDPAMLLSASAQREVEAAQGFRRFLETSVEPPTPARNEEVNLYSSDWEISAQDLSVDASRSMEANDDLESLFMADAQRERLATSNVPDLDNLFMERALRETGGVMPESVVASDFGIAFDDDSFERASPNEAVRFQVGRESPPARPFMARQVPTDGEVVARVGSRGFERVPRPSAEAIRAVEVRTIAREPVRHPRVAAAPAMSSEAAPSRLERLLGPSVLDD